MQVLENRENHALVENDDGEIELIPWSAENQLIHEHGLEGLIHERDEVLKLFTDEDRPTVVIAPALDQHEGVDFWFTIGELELPIRAHDRPDLIEALAEAYNGDETNIQPFYDLADGAMDTEVEKHTADQFVPLVVSAVSDEVSIEPQTDGWLINDHLLLTYDLEFKHPTVEIEKEHPDAERMGTGEQAYDLHLSQEAGQAELHDFSYGSMTEPLIEFVSKALWAGKYAPTGL